MSTFLQFWCKLNGTRIAKTVCFVSCIVIMVGDSLNVCFLSFLTILFRFPIWFHLVSLRFLGSFYCSVSPPFSVLDFAKLEQ